MRKYEVILKYPEWATDGEDQYYVSFVTGRSIWDAVKAAKESAAWEQAPEAAIGAGEFSMVAVIRGWDAPIMALGGFETSVGAYLDHLDSISPPRFTHDMLRDIVLNPFVARSLFGRKRMLPPLDIDIDINDWEEWKLADPRDIKGIPKRATHQEMRKSQFAAMMRKRLFTESDIEAWAEYMLGDTWEVLVLG